MCWDSIFLMPGKDNPILRILRLEHLLTVGGIFYTEKNFFFNTVGGFSEDYFGYGSEDNDLYTRVNMILDKNMPKMPYSIVHCYHHWHPIDGPDPYNEDSISHKYRKMVKYKNYWKLITNALIKANTGNEKSPTAVLSKLYPIYEANRER